MADITPISPALAGVNPSPAAASVGGDALINPRGNGLLVVNNGGGGSINVTIAAQTTARSGDGFFPAQTLGNNVVAVPAGAQRVIGPIPAAFNDVNGKAQITYSGVTSVTVYGIQPPQ